MLQKNADINRENYNSGKITHEQYRIRRKAVNNRIAELRNEKSLIGDRMNFNNIRKQISEFRERLSAFIDTLPVHAEGVTPLNKKGTCGIVSFSTIGKNKSILSPHYYLNSTPKEELHRIIRNTKLENLDKVIEEIIQTGRIPCDRSLILSVLMKCWLH